MKKVAAVVITLGLLVSASRGSQAAPVKTFLWEGPVAAGKTLDLRGLNGPIHAVRADGRQATVRATIKSRGSDVADRVRIEQWEEGGNRWFCSLHPGQRAGAPNPCERGAQKSTVRRNEKDELWVEWEVEVPAGVRLVAHTVNGNLELVDLDGPVEAATVNGSISLGTRDVAEATTVNGTIEARLGAGRLTHDLSFRTVNGSVVLELADGLGAEVLAEALNGEFESDFPVTLTGRSRQHRLRGTINGGGALLSMATVNGSLALRRHSSASK
jgi:hypothetical protein